MPGRDIILANEKYYHVFNRGINSQKIFSCSRDYFQFLDRVKYYQNKQVPFRYSQLDNLSLVIRSEILKNLIKEGDFLVDIIAFCLMPNHFHFLLKQKVQVGISKYLSNLTNSYTRYYNVKHKRIGPILQGKFKAVEVINDEQLLHLQRYIHLNPYSAGLVQSLKELLSYPYSSLPEFITGKKEICQSDIILNQFSDSASYKKFIADQADYQRSLELLKNHLEF